MTESRYDAAVRLEWLPAPGARVVLADGTTATVAYLAGWSWPLAADAPTGVLVALQGREEGREVRCIPARDAEGARFWLAERRDP